MAQEETTKEAVQETQSGPKVEVQHFSEDSESVRKDEINRMRRIAKLGHKFRCEAEAETAINDGTPASEFAEWVIQNRFSSEQVSTGSAAIGMEPKARESYSLRKAINQLASGKGLDGVEREASDAVSKKSRKEPNGFWLPFDLLDHSTEYSVDDVAKYGKRNFSHIASNVRSMQVTDNTKGGYFVQTDVLFGSMIELLRAMQIMPGLGAQTFPALTGNIAIPRHKGGVSGFWLAEGEEVALEDQDVGQLALTPHRLAASTEYTKQLLAQTSPAVEAFIRTDIMEALAIARDRAAINGTGANGQPRGIINTDGVHSVTFSATPTWAKILEFESKVAEAEAERGSLAYLTTPSSRATLKATEKAANTAQFLWQDNEVNGRPAVMSTHVPGNRMIYGNFNDVIMADWDGIDITVDPFSKARSEKIVITVNMYSDVGVRHGVSFAVSSDAANQ